MRKGAQIEDPAFAERATSPGKGREEGNSKAYSHRNIHTESKKTKAGKNPIKHESPAV